MSTTAELRSSYAQHDPRTRAGLELLVWLGKGVPTVNGGLSGIDLRIDVDELRYRSGAWSGGERRVVAVALSLIDAEPVDLDDVIGGLGGAHLRAVVGAIAAAAGVELA